MKIEQVLDFLAIRPLTTWESLIIGHIVVIASMIFCVYYITSYCTYSRGWEEGYSEGFYDRAKDCWKRHKERV